MTNQYLEALNFKIYQIERRLPKTYMYNARWKRYCNERERLTKELMTEKLNYEKRKIQRLNGRGTEQSETLVRQYENCLKNNTFGGKDEYQ